MKSGILRRSRERTDIARKVIASWLNELKDIRDFSEPEKLENLFSLSPKGLEICSYVSGHKLREARSLYLKKEISEASVALREAACDSEVFLDELSRKVKS